MAVVEVARSQYLSLEVEDRGQEVGKLSVFLPSSSAAEVRAQTVEGAEGLRLVTEPTGTGTTDDPSAGTSAAAASGGAGGQLAHVLWVGIALFAMAFAYVRNVVANTWSAEVQPLLGRMEGYLDERSTSATRVRSPRTRRERAEPADGPAALDQKIRTWKGLLAANIALAVLNVGFMVSATGRDGQPPPGPAIDRSGGRRDRGTTRGRRRLPSRGGPR